MEKPFQILHLNSKVLPWGFDRFIERVLIEVDSEIRRTAKSFYDYSPEEFKETNKGVDKIFSSIERTWVGIFNNALIKSDDSVTTLQEFAVWSNVRQEGRCDMLFEWNTCHFIVEAKSEEFKPNWPCSFMKKTFLLY